MKKITIGILAGMGPRSTSPFLEMLLDQCQEQYGAEEDMDYPHIIVYSLPTPFYMNRETDEEALKKAIKEGVERLQSFDVDIIGIPCNSAHNYFDFITQKVKVPTLNIVDETVKNIQEGSKVTVLATEMTAASGLYVEDIRHKHCEFVYDDTWQKDINQIISGVKRKSDVEGIKGFWRQLMDKIKTQQVTKVVVACTDLNVAMEPIDGIEYIDSAQALAKSLVERYLELTRRS